MDRFNGLDVPESLQDALDPATLAFVVYDMQAGILAQIADGDRVLANVLRLLAAARKRGVRTLFMRHYFMPTELAGVYQLRQAKMRDCAVPAYLIAGVATEVGIEPTVRHSTDLGYIPIVVRDAIVADTDEICATLTAAR
jgi:biuret amidohydrolase